MKTLKTSLAVAILFLFAWSSFAMAQESTVKVRGEGVIFHNDKAAATDKAVDDALRKAVEQVAGTMIQSSTLVENFITVEDKILSRAKGFVKTYKVLSKKEEDGVIVVEVSATVSQNNLKSELDAINWVTSQRENPRVMLLIAEQNVGQTGMSYWWGNTSGVVSMSNVENTLMEELQKFGFEVVDPSVLAGKITQGNAYQVTSAGTTNQAAREIGNLGEAQVVIVGTAVATIAGAVMEGSRLKSGQADISLRCINTDNGMVIVTDNTHAADAHISEVTAGNKALIKAAKKIAASLKGKIVDKWSQTAATVTLEVGGLKDYQMLVTLKQILQNEVRGVTGVRQRKMSKENATLDLYYKGKATDLAAELTGKKLKLKFKMDTVTPNKLVFSVSK